MYVIGTTGNFSNRSHRSMRHYSIGSPDAQLAKVIRQFLDRVHSELPRDPILTVRRKIAGDNLAISLLISRMRMPHTCVHQLVTVGDVNFVLRSTLALIVLVAFVPALVSRTQTKASPATSFSQRGRVGS